MRFLLRSLMGMVMLALTAGLVSFAGYSVVSAVREKAAQTPFARPARERTFTVNVVPFEPTTVVPEMTVFGQIESRRTLDLRAAVAGPVIEVSPNFTEGGRVSEGELLVRIDPFEAQTALARVKADVSDALAEQREATAALLLAKDDLAGVTAQRDLRSRALVRQQDLKDRGVGTDAAVEAAELAVAAADQAILTRRQAVQQAQARVDRADAQIERLDISRMEAERRLADTQIRAKFDGTLADVAVVEGTRAAQGAALAQLVDPAQLEVAFRLSTTQYARLLDDAGALTQAPVTVTLDVLGTDMKSSGVIAREGASVGEGQTGRLVFARLNDPRGMRPGDFVSVSIAEPALNWVVSLPAAAVNASGELLVLGEDERLEVVQAQVLRRQGDFVLVRARNMEGREVVTARSPVLGAGIKVRPLRADAVVEEPQTVALTPERRAKLVAFINANTRMPKAAKDRVLAQLNQDVVPARVVERIEARMGS
ncbi:efflux RND transporter periplasmic adaptor subunit [Nereida ignava]|uniref:Toluene efflux pump periplasmic linker protein TtgD n=1 Tax=Nereida ignava TaxID=282199 RepID=A0A0U1NKZ1_9RHOB|nr:HlyD family efflux transporter periplasmic adaptor subunit [Nereida ignava]CRK75396.1 Toluene efflux pump periplasmic linker protein TtgD precursor [Nereida ignava]SFJ54128.1 HlyD family secretion protein [Nereida ignava DSM 16309]